LCNSFKKRTFAVLLKAHINEEIDIFV